MKRNGIIKKNNKGIAMVTIMITIMFLAVIATTLLYISTTNYMMKIANINGKDNFYETDGELVKATSAIRNASMKEADPITAVNQLKTDPTNASCNTYSMLKIADLVYPGSLGDVNWAIAHNSDGDTVTFYTNDNTVSTVTGVTPGVTTYVFKDIQIIQTSTDGYQNSVKTDLQFDVFEKVSPGGSAGGVGNMSMMLDSPLVMSSANFKCLTMTGNCFMADFDTNSGSGYSFAGDPGKNYVGVGSNGVSMSNECRLNLKGTNNVIYGDLNLSGHASLAVYGNLTVYGDINVTDDATLIVAEGGAIYQYTEQVLPGKSTTSTFNAPSHNLYPSTVTVGTVDTTQFKNFATTIGLDNVSGEYGLIKKVFRKVPSLGNKRVIELNCNVETGSTYSSVFGWNDTSTGKSGKFDQGTGGPHGFRLQTGLYNNPSHAFGCAFLGKGLGNTALNGDYPHMIVISLNGSPLNMQESNPYTTWISNSSVTCSQAHCVTLSKVGTDEFNYMTAAKNDSESVAYNNSSNPFNNISFKFSDGYTGTYTGAFGDFFEQNCNLYVDQMFGSSLPGGGGTTSKTYYSAMNFTNYSRDLQ